MSYRGKKLGFYSCLNEAGIKAVVMASTPDQARRVLKKEGFEGYFTASFMGVIQNRPNIVFLVKPDISDSEV